MAVGLTSCTVTPADPSTGKYATQYPQTTLEYSIYINKQITVFVNELSTRLNQAVHSTDGVDKKTDYVWIKAYGLKAAEYAAALHIHSNVSINGAIQTRSYVKEYECPYCGQISKIAYLAVEVIPYSIEYGANCTLPDPQERGEESDETDEISGSFDSESD